METALKCLELLPAAIAEARSAKYHCYADHAFLNVQNLSIAMRLAWEKKELGSIEAWQFAHRNGTPIVPVGDCCHPFELVKRGYIDGFGWPDKPEGVRELERKGITVTRWQDGTHYYAKINGADVRNRKGTFQFDTYGEAIEAALKVHALTKPSPSGKV